MVDLNRQIRATQARQGGFSSHVLPGAVPYAVVTNLIIYYTATEVLSTNPDSVVTPSLFSGSSYGVTEFQGGNALRPTGGGYAGGFWTITFGSLNIGTNDFTMEAWGTIGSDDDDTVDIWIYGQFPFFCHISLFRNRFNGAARRKVTAKTSSSEGSNSLTEDSPTSFGSVHMAIQRINGLIYFHVGGSSVPYESIGTPSLDSLSEGYIEVGVGSSPLTANLGQVRLSIGGIYGTGSFTPPTGPFFTP
jgi:hypothetical protein